MKKQILLLFALVALVSLFADTASAQCAMCQGVANTSYEAGSTVAAGINKGVLYLFLMPWIIIGTVAFFWWKSSKKIKEEHIS